MIKTDLQLEITRKLAKFVKTEIKQCEGRKKYMKDQLGDAPIQEEYREKMQKLAGILDFSMNGTEKPKKNGFVLLMFKLDQIEGRMNYISNAEREDVIRVLKEQIRHFEEDK